MKLKDTTKQAIEEYHEEYLLLKNYDVPKEYIHFACMFVHNKQLSCRMLTYLLNLCVKYQKDINVYDYDTTDKFCRATAQYAIDEWKKKNRLCRKP